jgi:Flp pilus assembly protein TadB
MNVPPVLPDQPADQKPPSRGQKVAIFIEDVLIVLAVVYLLCMMIFGLRGPAWTALMYATLVAMIVVTVRRFRRIRRASENQADSNGTE